MPPFPVTARPDTSQIRHHDEHGGFWILGFQLYPQTYRLALLCGEPWIHVSPEDTAGESLEAWLTLHPVRSWVPILPTGAPCPTCTATHAAEHVAALETLKEKLAASVARVSALETRLIALTAAKDAGDAEFATLHLRATRQERELKLARNRILALKGVVVEETRETHKARATAAAVIREEIMGLTPRKTPAAPASPKKPAKPGIDPKRAEFEALYLKARDRLAWFKSRLNRAIHAAKFTSLLEGWLQLEALTSLPKNFDHTDPAIEADIAARIEIERDFYRPRLPAGALRKQASPAPAESHCGGP